MATHATLDIDIFIEPTIDNDERTRRALADTGFDVTGLTLDELLQRKS